MGLHHALEQEPVSALPLREPPVIDRACSVRETLQLMREKKLGCVFTVDNDNRPTGIFSERLLARLLAKNPAHLNDPITEHTINIRCIANLTDPIITVIHQMQNSDIRFVCVVDDQGKLVGLTGQRGVMEYITERFPRLIKGHQMASKLSIDEREGA